MIRISITNHKSVSDFLGRLQHRIEDPGPALSKAGKLLAGRIRQRISVGGDPAFAPLAQSTLAQRKRRGGSTRPLTGSGKLMRSIGWSVTEGRLQVSSSSPYAAIHHFGGRTGRGGATKIPARPFMNVKQRDRNDIGEIISDYLAGKGGS